MRFRTVWFSDISNTFPLKEKLRRSRDIIAMKIAGKLPLRIRYWVTIIEIGHATHHSTDVMATTTSDILKNLRAPKVVA